MTTVAEAQKMLDMWIAAEKALVLSGAQSYSIGSRSLTRLNIAEIRRQIDYWRNQRDAAKIRESGGRVKRARRFIPRDL